MTSPSPAVVQHRRQHASSIAGPSEPMAIADPSPASLGSARRHVNFVSFDRLGRDARQIRPPMPPPQPATGTRLSQGCPPAEAPTTRECDTERASLGARRSSLDVAFPSTRTASAGAASRSSTALSSSCETSADTSQQKRRGCRCPPDRMASAEEGAAEAVVAEEDDRDGFGGTDERFEDDDEADDPTPLPPVHHDPGPSDAVNGSNAPSQRQTQPTHRTRSSEGLEDLAATDTDPGCPSTDPAPALSVGTRSSTRRPDLVGASTHSAAGIGSSSDLTDSLAGHDRLLGFRRPSKVRARRLQTSTDKEEDGEPQKKESVPSTAIYSGKEEKSNTSCCICLEEPEPADLATVNGCPHTYCFGCIEKWADRENTCPLCKLRFTTIERVQKQKQTPLPFSSKKRKGDKAEARPMVKHCKRVGNRDQRADFHPNNPLNGLLASLEATGTMLPSIAQLIFSGLGSNNGDLWTFPSDAQNLARARHSGRLVPLPSASRGSSRRSLPIIRPAPIIPSLEQEGMQYLDFGNSAFRGGTAANNHSFVASSNQQDITDRRRIIDPEFGDDTHTASSYYQAIASRSDLTTPFLLHHPHFGEDFQSDDLNAAAFGRFYSLNNQSQYPGGAFSAHPTAAASSHDNDISVPQSESDDDGGYGSFVQRVRNLSRDRNNAIMEQFQYGSMLPPHGGGDGGSVVLRSAPLFPVSTSHWFLPRSFAVNAHDLDAGHTMDNALEIEDSDDDDDVVEVMPIDGHVTL